MYNLLTKFLTIFGNIKIFKAPFWLVYDPDDYQILGEDVFDILALLKPGDIILRGYNRYLDGKFIPNFKNARIGKGFSHGGIYVGNNTVVHAVAEGASEINIIDFLQCDRIAIFRPKKGQKNAIKLAKKFLDQKTPYDFGFERGTSAVYCFELCIECYPKLKFPRFNVSKLFGLLRKKDVYIAQSFIDSFDVQLIYCKNPNSKIYYNNSKLKNI